ncbi:effector-associated domain 2-containing protein, partial [Amycolatopsis pretoriensis]|uniref:effector-associated domain 2-containing protein n=1 Tax=Amycolatopsis pretoriensis TaxID=218821 RepID=UPI001177B94F
MTSWNGSDYPSSLGFLIDCLEQIPSLRDPGSRRLCLELLADHLGMPLVVEDLPTTRASLIGIVQACRRQHPRALSAFVDAVEQMEPGSIPVQRARSAVEDMATLDLVTEYDRQELLNLLGENPSRFSSS